MKSGGNPVRFHVQVLGGKLKANLDIGKGKVTCQELTMANQMRKSISAWVFVMMWTLYLQLLQQAVLLHECKFEKRIHDYFLHSSKSGKFHASR